MTNDLAIKILTGDVLGTTEQTHEAVEMAVKALSALPSADVTDTNVGNNDLISRQDAIKVLTRKEREEFNDWERSGDERSLCAKKAYSSSIFVIYDLPSVDAVKVVRCEQCKHYNNIDFYCYYHGSMCFKPNDYCPYGEVRDDEGLN